MYFYIIEIFINHFKSINDVIDVKGLGKLNAVIGKHDLLKEDVFFAIIFGIGGKPYDTGSNVDNLSENVHVKLKFAKANGETLSVERTKRDFFINDQNVLEEAFHNILSADNISIENAMTYDVQNYGGFWNQLNISSKNYALNYRASLEKKNARIYKSMKTLQDILHVERQKRSFLKETLKEAKKKCISDDLYQDQIKKTVMFNLKQHEILRKENIFQLDVINTRRRFFQIYEYSDVGQMENMLKQNVLPQSCLLAAKCLYFEQKEFYQRKSHHISYATKTLKVLEKLRENTQNMTNDPVALTMETFEIYDIYVYQSKGEGITNLFHAKNAFIDALYEKYLNNNKVRNQTLCDLFYPLYVNESVNVGANETVNDTILNTFLNYSIDPKNLLYTQCQNTFHILEKIIPEDIGCMMLNIFKPSQPEFKELIKSVLNEHELTLVLFRKIQKTAERLLGSQRFCFPSMYFNAFNCRHANRDVNSAHWTQFCDVKLNANSNIVSYIKDRYNIRVVDTQEEVHNSFINNLEDYVVLRNGQYAYKSICNINVLHYRRCVNEKSKNFSLIDKVYANIVEKNHLDLMPKTQSWSSDHTNVNVQNIEHADEEIKRQTDAEIERLESSKQQLISNTLINRSQNDRTVWRNFRIHLMLRIGNTKLVVVANRQEEEKFLQHIYKKIFDIPKGHEYIIDKSKNRYKVLHCKQNQFRIKRKVIGTMAETHQLKTNLEKLKIKTLSALHFASILLRGNPIFADLIDKIARKEEIPSETIAYETHDINVEESEIITPYPIFTYDIPGIVANIRRTRTICKDLKTSIRQRKSEIDENKQKLITGDNAYRVFLNENINRINNYLRAANYNFHLHLDINEEFQNRIKCITTNDKIIRFSKLTQQEQQFLSLMDFIIKCRTEKIRFLFINFIDIYPKVLKKVVPIITLFQDMQIFAFGVNIPHGDQLLAIFKQPNIEFYLFRNDASQ